ncbi:MAG: hypothetical protein EOO43_21045 [Flavobacterium sp.]|nr:MAG: hypothetical protein EOO43_21045 [Flavobacterium sp.]
MLNGSKNDGLPDDKPLDLLSKCEDDMLLHLNGINGHLYLGRQVLKVLDPYILLAMNFGNARRLLIERKYQSISRNYLFDRNCYDIRIYLTPKLNPQLS